MLLVHLSLIAESLELDWATKIVLNGLLMCKWVVVCYTINFSSLVAWHFYLILFLRFLHLLRKLFRNRSQKLIVKHLIVFRRRNLVLAEARVAKCFSLLVCGWREHIVKIEVTQKGLLVELLLVPQDVLILIQILLGKFILVVHSLYSIENKCTVFKIRFQ